MFINLELGIINLEQFFKLVIIITIYIFIYKLALKKLIIA